MLASSWRLGGAVCEGEIQGRSNSRLGDPWPGGASARTHMHTRTYAKVICADVSLCTDTHVGGHACTQHMQAHADSRVHKQTTHWRTRSSIYAGTGVHLHR